MTHAPGPSKVQRHASVTYKLAAWPPAVAVGDETDLRPDRVAEAEAFPEPRRRARRAGSNACPRAVRCGAGRISYSRSISSAWATGASVNLGQGQAPNVGLLIRIAADQHVEADPVRKG